MGAVLAPALRRSVTTLAASTSTPVAWLRPHPSSLAGRWVRQGAGLQQAASEGRPVIRSRLARWMRQGPGLVLRQGMAPSHRFREGLPRRCRPGCVCARRCSVAVCSSWPGCED